MIEWEWTSECVSESERVNEWAGVEVSHCDDPSLQKTQTVKLSTSSSSTSLIPNKKTTSRKVHGLNVWKGTSDETILETAWTNVWGRTQKPMVHEMNPQKREAHTKWLDPKYDWKDRSDSSQKRVVYKPVTTMDQNMTTTILWSDSDANTVSQESSLQRVITTLPKERSQNKNNKNGMIKMIKLVK